MVDDTTYDLIVVGSSFASAFFVHRYLSLTSGKRKRVLILEKGAARSHEWLGANQNRFLTDSLATIDFGPPQSKAWEVRIALGGASNSWWACVPRLLPEDFELRSKYGVGTDWPIRYGDLEEYYCDAEDIMAVSGSVDSPSPRSRPYPQPPHLFSQPDMILKSAWGSSFVNQPTARARFTTKRGRSKCCALGVCHQCPVDSKFTIINELGWLFEDQRVDLVTEAEVRSIDIRNGSAVGVHYMFGDLPKYARGDFIALGAGAIFNPFILLKSGLNDSTLGQGLCEQVGLFVRANLLNVDNFQGSTAITGHGYPFYSGQHRKDRAACIIETFNFPILRNQRGKYRHFLLAKFIFEDYRLAGNRVVVSDTNPNKPTTIFKGPSQASERSLADASAWVDSFLKPLELESAPSLTRTPTEGHILGTVVMGRDPASSVVDHRLCHHRVRNLAVLGGSAFPTAAPANPTLTICALSLYSAQSIFGRTVK